MLDGDSTRERTGQEMLQKFGLISVCVFALNLSGCGSDKSEEETQTAAFQDLALVLKVPAGFELDSFVESDVLDWSGRSGADVEIQMYESGDEFQPGDVVLLSLSDLPDMYDRFAAIPDGHPGTEELQFSSLLRGVRDRVASVGGRPAVMPFSCPTLVCAYRRDLLEGAGLKPPRTWDDYDTLVRTRGDWAPGLSVAEPLGPDDRMLGIAARTIAHSCPEGSVGVFFDLQTGSPLATHPGFARAIGQLKKIAPELGDSWAYTVADCRRELVEGRAAIGLMYEPVFADSETLSRAENAELGFCPLPGARQVYDRLLEDWKDVELNRPGLVGRDGLVIGVVRGDRTNNLAGLSLVAAVADRVMKSVDTRVRGVVADWQVDTVPDLLQPLTHKEARSYVAATVSSANTRSLIQTQPLPASARFTASLVEVLTPESLAKRTPEELGAALSSQWSAVIDELGKAEFLKKYRWSNGLTP